MILGIILMSVAGLASLACWIIVLVKMFKTQESPLMGIIGIFCGLWAFIWGWMNAGKLALGKVMMIWTLSFVLTLVGYGLFAKGAIDMAKEQGINFNPSTLGQPIESSPAIETTTTDEAAEEPAPAEQGSATE